MKRILFCLMMYGSYANATLMRNPMRMTIGELWLIMERLWHNKFALAHPDLDLPRNMPMVPLNQPLVHEPQQNVQDQQHAQKLEAREKAKHAWRQGRHHDNNSKKNKWVCQQPRSKK